MILLIRHGETPGNASRVFQHPETPLSETGRAQAEQLARRLARDGIHHILASDYQRALETARALERASGCALETEPLLRERDFGALRGRPYAEIEADPFAADFVPPGGESTGDFERRAARAWERILACRAARPGPLAVVTHGLVCRALVQQHARLGLDAGALAFGNTSVTRIEAEPPFRVTLLGCTAHLSDATASPRRAPGA